MATVRSKRARAERVFNRDNGACAYCRQALDLTERMAGGWTIDHVVPRAKGGTDDEDNLVPSCFPCNQLKADLSVEEFREKVQQIIASYRRFIDRLGPFAAGSDEV